MRILRKKILSLALIAVFIFVSKKKKLIGREVGKAYSSNQPDTKLMCRCFLGRSLGSRPAPVVWCMGVDLALPAVCMATLQSRRL